MLCDGGVYESAAIKQWLRHHDSAPCTNVPLAHRKLLRLNPLRKVLEAFLAGIGAQSFSHDHQLLHEMQVVDYVDSASAHCKGTLMSLHASISRSSNYVNVLPYLI